MIEVVGVYRFRPTKRSMADAARALGELEEAHASLSNKLTLTQAIFNKVVGRQLSIGAPVDEAELANLHEALERVGEEVAVRAHLENLESAEACP